MKYECLIPTATPNMDGWECNHSLGLYGAVGISRSYPRVLSSGDLFSDGRGESSLVLLQGLSVIPPQHLKRLRSAS